MIANLSASVDAFTANAFLVSGERTVLVDAGANFDVVAAVRERAADLDAVVLTHTHEDHVGNVPALREAFDVETWGFDAGSEHVDHAIADGERVRIGDDDYEALHTPGHKGDHLVFHAADQREAANGASGEGRPESHANASFVGDLVFAGGAFGRTDLAEGDRAALCRSIERLRGVLSASDDVLYAGHGPAITDPQAAVAESLRAARSAAP